MFRQRRPAGILTTTALLTFACNFSIEPLHRLAKAGNRHSINRQDLFHARKSTSKRLGVHQPLAAWLHRLRAYPVWRDVLFELLRLQSAVGAALGRPAELPPTCFQRSAVFQVALEHTGLRAGGGAVGDCLWRGAGLAAKRRPARHQRLPHHLLPPLNRCQWSPAQSSGCGCSIRKSA